MIKLSLETKRDRQTETAIKEFLGRADDEGLEYFMICKLSDSYDDVDVNELMKVGTKAGYTCIETADLFAFVKYDDSCLKVKIHYEDGAILQWSESYDSCHSKHHLTVSHLKI